MDILYNQYMLNEWCLFLLESFYTFVFSSLCQVTMDIFNSICCSVSVPSVIETIDTIAPVNGTVKRIAPEKIKQNGISPDALKSRAQLRLHGESGKFC